MHNIFFSTYHKCNWKKFIERLFMPCRNCRKIVCLSVIRFWTCDILILVFCFSECRVSLHSTGICTQEGWRNGRDEATPLLDRESQQFSIKKVIINNLGYKLANCPRYVMQPMDLFGTQILAHLGLNLEMQTYKFCYNSKMVKQSNEEKKSNMKAGVICQKSEKEQLDAKFITITIN